MPVAARIWVVTSTPIGNSVKAKGVCREVEGIVACPFEIKLGFITFIS